MPEDKVHTFVRMRAVRRSGRLHEMRELEAKVYIVLVEECQYQSGLVKISAERIAFGELGYPRSGICTNLGRVRKAFQKLRAMGVLETTDPGGGREHVPTHRMLLIETIGMPLFDPPPSSPPACPPFIPETGTASVPVCEVVKGDGARLERGTVSVPESSAKGDGARPQRGTAAVPRNASAPKSPPPAEPRLRNSAPQRGTASVPLYGKEEEEKVLKLLTDKHLWPGTREEFARLLKHSEALGIWHSLVNDKAVPEKGRPGAYFKRLTQFLRSQRRLDAA